MQHKADKGKVHYRWLDDQTEVMIINHKGKTRVLNSLCPHMGARLECNFKSNKQHCPWHGLEFDLDTLLSTHPRFQKNKEFKIKDFNLNSDNDEI